MTREKRKILYLIVLMSSLGQLCVDLYVPSLPSITKDFHASAVLIRMTIPAFLLSFGIAQFIFGPISDCKGRRRVLLSGVILALLGLIAAYLSRNPMQLILARVLQGLGVGGSTVVARSSMRDVYRGKELSQASACIAFFILTIPTVAPMFGGYIEVYLGWRFTFLILSLFAFLALLTFLFFHKETLRKENREHLGVRGVFRVYGKMCRNRTFLPFSIMSACCYGFFITYATASTFLFQDGLHVTPEAFGWYLLIIASSLGVGAILCSRLVHRFKLTTLLSVGSLLIVCGAIAFFLLAMVNMLSIPMLIVPVYVSGLGAGLNFPNCTTGALTGYKKNAGKAGALVGATQMVMSFIFTFIISRLSTTTALPLSLVLLLIAVLNFLVYFTFIRPHFVEETE
jgi:Bcr/CflA subfamily drug resistance transporter